MRKYILWAISWYLRRQIWCVDNLITADIVDRTDIKYLGKSDDYWNGHGDGLNDCLKILELSHVTDYLKS
jgi:hypothetical protein